MSKSRYGKFGGSFMPEALMAPLKELEVFFDNAIKNIDFLTEYNELLANYAGRPTAFTEVSRFRNMFGGPRLFLKREDLLHTGAHKINNALGQCLLAKKMGKSRIIAETGAGQHGVATATACAYFGLDCEVYMGDEDINRQHPNVLKMKLLGAKVISVNSGTKTLKDAVNAALRDYAAHFPITHYCLGSALGPYPYPRIVEYFQSIIGLEVVQQCQATLGKKPDIIIACVGGGSNAIGVFAPFIQDQSVRLIGVEAGGKGFDLGQHAARFVSGRPGVLHGCYSYLLQNTDGQISDTHSISAGLDYPMVGPQHAELFESGRVEYSSVNDELALEAFQALVKSEGIIPALESSHALGFYIREAQKFDSEKTIVINLSGRGDKDLPSLLARGIL
ncbi:MAG: tryptophan synthase subunit beta [Legionellales bacterium RIFCSPHIGHO2_12_FULL_35_11]|nr:MAG: tryptophan synthase subunit beta [Legionellales bacterium RIFCSPHIGHO2_12_FULL_35_11]